VLTAEEIRLAGLVATINLTPPVTLASLARSSNTLSSAAVITCRWRLAVRASWRGLRSPGQPTIRSRRYFLPQPWSGPIKDSFSALKDENCASKADFSSLRTGQIEESAGNRTTPLAQRRAAARPPSQHVRLACFELFTFWSKELSSPSLAPTLLCHKS